MPHGRWEEAADGCDGYNSADAISEHEDVADITTGGSDQGSGADEAVQEFWDRYSSFGGRDETPSPEETESVEGILQAVLVRKPLTLPFAGFDEDLAKDRTLVLRDGEEIKLPLRKKHARRLVAKYGTDEASFAEIGEEQIQLGEDAWFYGLAENIITHLGLEDTLYSDDDSVDFKVQKLVVCASRRTPMGMIDAAMEDDGDVEAVLIAPLSGDGTITIREADNVEHHYEWSAKSNKDLNFVVCAPDAQFTLGRAKTHGGQAALIYSVSLLPSFQFLSRRSGPEPIRKKLSQVRSLYGPVALLLNNEYADSDLAGLTNLTGKDLERVQILKTLNGMTSADRNLKLMPVKLVREIKYYPMAYPDEWEEEKREDSITWCSIGPNGVSSKVSEDIVSVFSYLNPDLQTIKKLWAVRPTTEIEMPSEEANRRYEVRYAQVMASIKKNPPRSDFYHDHDYTSFFPHPPMPTKRVRYTKDAVIILPSAKDVESIVKLSGNEVAAAFVRYQAFGNADKLRLLLETAETFYDDSLEWWQLVCDCLVHTNDMELVTLFFEKFRCGEFVSAALASPLSVLVSCFGWKAITPLYLTRIRSEATIESFLDLTVHLVDNLNSPKLKKRVLKTLFDEAMYWGDHRLGQYHDIALLWKCALDCGSKSTFDRLVALIKSLGTGWDIIEQLAKYADKEGFSTRESEAFFEFVDRRVEALQQTLSKRDKPASWEIPDAQFPDDPAVEAFLRGPEESLVLPAWGDEDSARAWMKSYFAKSYSSMFSMEYRASEPGKWAVTLSKDGSKHAPGDAYWPGTERQLAELLAKYYPSGSPNPAYLSLDSRPDTYRKKARRNCLDSSSAAS